MRPKTLCRLFVLTLIVVTAACSGEPPVSSSEAEDNLASVGSATGASYSALNLGSLSGSASIAQGINESGVVVGLCTLAPGEGEYRACVWRQPGVLPPEALPDLPDAANSQASDVNDVGDIVGVTASSTGRGLRATLWPAGGGVIDLGPTLNVNLPSINKRGEAVWATPTGTPFAPGPTRVSLLRHGVVRDLGEAVPNNGNGIGSPGGISNAGLIAATGGTFWALGKWRALARPVGTAAGLLIWRVTDDGQIVGQLGAEGGAPETGVWWPVPGLAVVLSPGFVPYDLGRFRRFVGSARISLPEGRELTVPATFRLKLGVEQLPVPDGNDPRGRAIRINGSGWIVGYSIRPSATVFGALDNMATIWIPEGR